MTLHAQLRAAYLASGRSMGDIAHSAGVHENTAARALGPRPQYMPDARTLIALAQALGLTEIKLDAYVPRQKPPQAV